MPFDPSPQPAGRCCAASPRRGIRASTTSVNSVWRLASRSSSQPSGAAEAHDGANLLNRLLQVGLHLVIRDTQDQIARYEQLVIAVAVVGENWLRLVLRAIEF